MDHAEHALAATAADLDGTLGGHVLPGSLFVVWAAIWIAEYLRYRTSGCDHATAVQRTMTQIDGNPAPATCLVQCAYNVDTPAGVSADGGTFLAYPRRTSGSCEWAALSEAPWPQLNLASLAELLLWALGVAALAAAVRMIAARLPLEPDVRPRPAPTSGGE